MAASAGRTNPHYFPSLVDRLRDTPDENVADWDELREIVMRDLTNLLNARNHEYLADDETGEAFPLARNSVINFGVPDSCGRAMSPEGLSKFVKSVEEAIRVFEPRLRLDPKNAVRIAGSTDAKNGCVGIQIRGELKSEPIPEWLCIQTELDFETGRGAVRAVSESDLDDE